MSKSEYLKISDAEYAVMLEKARRTLESLSQESVQKLRTKCSDELSHVINRLQERMKRYDEIIKVYEEPVDYKKDIPVRQAKRKFWLGQIANFIAVSVFKLPREFTPTYRYPHGLSKVYEKFAQSHDDKILAMGKESKSIAEASLSGLLDMKKNITSDDTRLINFCTSCTDSHAADSTVNSSPIYSEFTSLMYQNNVSFPVDSYRTNVKLTELADNISSMVGNVSDAYRQVKGNVISL